MEKRYLGIFKDIYNQRRDQTTTQLHKTALIERRQNGQSESKLVRQQCSKVTQIRPTECHYVHFL